MIQDNGISFDDYTELVKETNKFPLDKTLLGAQLGLYSEVGSLISLLKKKLLNSDANYNSTKMVIEELGDIFWYFTLILLIKNIDFSKLLSKDNCSDERDSGYYIIGLVEQPIIEVNSNIVVDDSQQLFNDLMTQTVAMSNKPSTESAKEFLNTYLIVISYLDLNLLEVVRSNIFKIKNRFIPIERLDLPLLSFDSVMYAEKTVDKNLVN